MGSAQTFRLRIQKLSKDEAKAYLACAVDFDPRDTTLEVSSDETYDFVTLTEKTSGFALALKGENAERKGPPPWIDITKLQLGEWSASDRQGNAVAARALDLIKYYEAEIEQSKGE